MRYFITATAIAAVTGFGGLALYAKAQAPSPLSPLHQSQPAQQPAPVPASPLSAPAQTPPSAANTPAPIAAPATQPATPATSPSAQPNTPAPIAPAPVSPAPLTSPGTPVPAAATQPAAPLTAPPPAIGAASPAPENPQTDTAVLDDERPVTDTSQIPGDYFFYAFTDCEFAMALPEAPQVFTIRSEETPIPYLSNQPKMGVIGEVAVYKRVNPDTKEFVSAEFSCVNATREDLAALDPTMITEILTGSFGTQKIEREQFKYKPGSGTHSWGIYSGFSLDKDNKQVIHNIAHFVTGNLSIGYIKLSYSTGNSSFKRQFETMDRSIKMVGQ